MHYEVTLDDSLEANYLALGDRSKVIRRNELLSALGRPYHGYHESIYDKAAALVHAIISNHPFIDGNKRTGLYLTELLLKRSGYDLDVEDQELYEKFVLIAGGEFKYEQIREWLWDSIVPSH